MSSMSSDFPVLPLLPVPSKATAGRAERRKRLLATGSSPRRAESGLRRSQSQDSASAGHGAGKRKSWKMLQGKQKYNRASSKRDMRAQVGDFYNSLESTDTAGDDDSGGSVAASSEDEIVEYVSSPRRSLTREDTTSMSQATVAPGAPAARKSSRSGSRIGRGGGRASAHTRGTSSSTTMLPTITRADEKKKKKKKDQKQEREAVKQAKAMMQGQSGRQSTSAMAVLRKSAVKERHTTSCSAPSGTTEKKKRRKSFIANHIPTLQLTSMSLTFDGRAKSSPDRGPASPSGSAPSSPNRSRGGSSPRTPRSHKGSPRTPRRGSQIRSPRSGLSPPLAPSGPKKKAGLSRTQLPDLSMMIQGQSLRKSDSMVKVTTVDMATYNSQCVPKPLEMVPEDEHMDIASSILSPPMCSTSNSSYAWTGDDHMGDDTIVEADIPEFSLDDDAPADLDVVMEGQPSAYLRTSVGSDSFTPYGTKPQQPQQPQQQQQQQQQHPQQQARQAPGSAPGLFGSPASSSSGRSFMLGAPFKTSQDPIMPLISNKWNEIFQKSMQNLHELRSAQQQSTSPSLAQSIGVYDKLHELAQNFAYTAATYGKVIIAEHHLPEHLKTVRTANLGGQAGGKKYLAHDVVFKFAVDDKNIYNNNDDLAMKVAGHELKSMDTLLSCNIPGLYFPLVSIVDYRGFRLLAVSSLPIDSRTLLVGSADAGKSVEMKCPELLAKMSSACEHLNLKKHRVGASPNGPELCGPIDLEGHMGKDKRHYLLDFSRLFPPDLVNEAKPNSYLYELFRPEFVKQYKDRLCSDACSQFVAQQPDAREHAMEVREAHSHLVNVTIPGFVMLLIGLKGDAAELFLNAPKHLVLSIHRQGINLRYLGHLRSLMLGHMRDPEALRKKFVKHSFVPLPKKHFINNLKSDIVESRRIVLETFLEDALMKPEVCTSSELVIFLMPSDNYTEAQTLSTKTKATKLKQPEYLKEQAKKKKKEKKEKEGKGRRGSIFFGGKKEKKEKKGRSGLAHNSVGADETPPDTPELDLRQNTKRSATMDVLVSPRQAELLAATAKLKSRSKTAVEEPASEAPRAVAEAPAARPTPPMGRPQLTSSASSPAVTRNQVRANTVSAPIVAPKSPARAAGSPPVPPSRLATSPPTPAARMPASPATAPRPAVSPRGGPRKPGLPVVRGGRGRGMRGGRGRGMRGRPLPTPGSAPPKPASAPPKPTSVPPVPGGVPPRPAPRASEAPPIPSQPAPSMVPEVDIDVLPSRPPPPVPME